MNRLQKHEPDVSVIIVNYNTRELTKACIESIYQHTKKNSFEVLVIDNASTDGSDRVLSALPYENYRYILNKINEGFSKANNRAATMTTGEYLFFLNSDILLLNDVVSHLTTILKTDSRKGIAGPMFQNPDGTLQISCRQFPNILFGISRFVPFSGRVMPNQVSQYYQQHRDYSREQCVDTVSAGALMISKKLFDRIGGFDTFSFMYAEDADICRRVREQGHMVAFCPSARLLHYGGQSSKRNSYRAIWSYYFAFYHLYKKYYFGRGAIVVKPLFFLRACMAMAVNLFASDRRITWNKKK